MLCIWLEISYTGHYIKVHTIHPQDLLSSDEEKKNTRAKGGCLSLHWVGRFCWFEEKKKKIALALIESFPNSRPASKRAETIAVKW